jgi:hypothetical protein
MDGALGVVERGFAEDGELIGGWRESCRGAEVGGRSCVCGRDEKEKEDCEDIDAVDGDAVTDDAFVVESLGLAEDGSKLSRRFAVDSLGLWRAEGLGLAARLNAPSAPKLVGVE